MDDALRWHQRRIDAAGARVGELERRGHSAAAERLRSVHERVSGSFATLRRAFRDDWRSMQADAEEGWGELRDELRSTDSLFVEWHDEEIDTLDQALDELTQQIEALHADNVASRERRLAVDAAGLAELQAEIGEAKQRRQRIASPKERQAIESYSAAVRAAVDHWTRLNKREVDGGDMHPEVR
jgi:hypothetical protein